MQRSFQSALLLDSDHTEFDEVAIEEVAPNLAIGISCGRFPKGYPHADPNEDAVFAATDGNTTILAVADGHHGFDAACAAITAIAEAATAPTDETAQLIVRRLTVTAIDAVAATVPFLPPPRGTSRTALTVAVIRDDSFATTTIGDTACFVATRSRAKRLGTPTDFLSPDKDPAAIGVETVRLPRGAQSWLRATGSSASSAIPNWYCVRRRACMRRMSPSGSSTPHCPEAQETTSPSLSLAVSDRAGTSRILSSVQASVFTAAGSVLLTEPRCTAVCGSRRLDPSQPYLNWPDVESIATLSPARRLSKGRSTTPLRNAFSDRLFPSVLDHPTKTVADMAVRLATD